jgi:G3E family GTPase
LLNKTDLMPAEKVDELEGLIRQMNGVAKLHRTIRPDSQTQETRATSWRIGS